MITQQSWPPLSAWVALTKPRLSTLSVITGMVGYAVAPAPFSWSRSLAVAVGMGLAAGSAATINQWMERARDGCMERTRTRPIPSGLIRPTQALVFGILIGVLGLGILFLFTPPLAGILTVLTLVSYLLIYTPSKAWTSWCTAIGTIPGALPPLIGWAASEGTLAPNAWMLFALMVAWQIPHFMAIAWTYRNDYALAELPMISVTDESGRAAAHQAILFTALLVLVTTSQWAVGPFSLAYGVIAGVLGLWMLALGVKFLRETDRDRSARKLFHFTLIYLPLVLGAGVLDIWL
jgi:heme o synthase